VNIAHVDGINGCCALLVIQLRSKYICCSFVHSSIHPQSSVQTCNEREQRAKRKRGRRIVATGMRRIVVKGSTRVMVIVRNF
jgi:hypothetical protein